MEFYEDIISRILSEKTLSKDKLHQLKITLCKKYNLKTIPSNSSILAHIPKDFSENDRKLLVSVLRKKPMRTISGVAIVAVMTSPEACPHGTCIPCPGGPEYHSPQSYTGSEPAAMRAILVLFPFNSEALFLSAAVMELIIDSNFWSLPSLC